MIDDLSQIFDTAIDKNALRGSSNKLQKATVEYSDALINLLVEGKENTIKTYTDAINGNAAQYLGLGEMSKLTKEELAQKKQVLKDEIYDIDELTDKEVSDLIEKTKIEIEILHPNKLNSISCTGKLTQITLD